jgi:hypothetical protein
MNKLALLIIFAILTFAVTPSNKAYAQFLWWKKDKTEASKSDTPPKKRSLFNRQKTNDNNTWNLPVPAPRSTQTRRYQSQTLKSLESYGLDQSLAPEVALDKIANLDNGRQTAEANTVKIEAARQIRTAQRAQQQALAQAQLLRQQALEAQNKGLPQSKPQAKTILKKKKSASRPKIRPFIPRSKIQETDNKPRRLFNPRD